LSRLPATRQHSTPRHNGFHFFFRHVKASGIPTMRLLRA
jgi:hypothetical protein